MISRKRAFGARFNSARTAAVTSSCFSMIIVQLSEALLVCFAAKKTCNLPAGRLLNVTHLLTANGQHRFQRHEPDLATRCEHLDDGEHRVRWRLVGDDAHQIEAEYLDHGCILSGAGAYFNTVADGKYPVGCIRLRRI